MKTKHVSWAVAVVVVLAASWFGRAAWRAHHNIVTLHVRNAPLSQVIRQIERQTWKHIDVDKNLNPNALVTLNVNSQLISTVLDRIASQVGARWTTIYAVYESKLALPKLESSLRGEKKLDEAGWKTIAPTALALDPGFSGDGTNSPRIAAFASGNPGGAGGGPIIIRGGKIDPANLPADMPDDIKAQIAAGNPSGGTRVIATEDADINIPEANSPTGNKQGKQRRIQGAPVIRMMRSGADGMESEIWSPQEIVLESRLAPQLGSEFNEQPTTEAAARAAQKVKGRWKTYYALRKSPFGMGFAGMPPMMMNLNRATPGQGDAKTVGGTNSNKIALHGSPSGDDLAAAMRQRRFEELGRLSPEQRVQQARERKEHAQKQ